MGLAGQHTAKPNRGAPLVPSTCCKEGSVTASCSAPRCRPSADQQAPPGTVARFPSSRSTAGASRRPVRSGMAFMVTKQIQIRPGHRSRHPRDPFWWPARRYAAGPSVPSLTDLDAGDTKPTTTFRDVYATLLRDVLGADPEPVLALAGPLCLCSQPRSRLRVSIASRAGISRTHLALMRKHSHSRRA
jgi:hypothetical protein